MALELQKPCYFCSIQQGACCRSVDARYPRRRWRSIRCERNVFRWMQHRRRPQATGHGSEDAATWVKVPFHRRLTEEQWYVLFAGRTSKTTTKSGQIFAIPSIRHILQVSEILLWLSLRMLQPRRPRRHLGAKPSVL